VWVPALCAQVLPGRYIVELAGRPAAVTAVSRAAMDSPRRAVRTEQARLRPLLERSGARVLGSAETVANVLVVSIPDSQAARLASLAGVARVHRVRAAKAYLDHALGLHKVPEAWASIGGPGNAGTGVKIAILDSGIALDHPAFQGSSLTVPPGFPLANTPRDLAFTNNKVIVARNYVALATPQDAFGHGTAVAMEAAGGAASGPLGSITGVAPRAWLGNYKVFHNDEPFGEDTVLRAIDDAVNDGMDIINLSLGVSLAERIGDDILVAAVERAAAMGVIVSVAAGNAGGSPNSIASPATAPSAIATGASVNDRIFAPGLVRDGSQSYYAIPGYGRAAADTVSAPVADVAPIDGNGEACTPLAAGSLSGRIAMVARSPRSGPACSFTYKLNNLQSAGAVAAVVYMNPDDPGLVTMDVAAATLPAVSVESTFADSMRRQLRQGQPPTLTIQFTTTPLPQNANMIAPFSSRGPNVDSNIKPDLVATGMYVYTATQKTNPLSFLYGPTGFIREADGTSFSAPLVTGAAALLKSARPGLTAAQYRSLLINSASPLENPGAAPFPVQWTGAGILNVNSALQNTVAVSPVSLGFGTGPGTADMVREITIANLGTADDTFSILAGPSISLAANTLRIGAGESQKIGVRFSAASLSAGEYQGYLRIRGTQSAITTTVPYWYGVPDRIPKYLSDLLTPEAGSPGTAQHIYFRVTDLTGLPLASPVPAVRATGQQGSVVSVISEDADSPGVFHATVLLGDFEGPNIFEIQVGQVKRQITIIGQI
jgi:minor extracellular serine protease Vpr